MFTGCWRKAAPCANDKSPLGIASALRRVRSKAPAFVRVFCKASALQDARTRAGFNEKFERNVLYARLEPCF